MKAPSALPREATDAEVAAFDEAERQLLVRRFGWIAPPAAIATILTEIAALFTPEFPSDPGTTAAIVGFLGLLWVWSRRARSRTEAALIWLLSGWGGAFYTATACVESGRFRSLHVLGIAAIIAITPAAISFKLRESIASLGGVLVAWVLVGLFWQVPDGGVDVGGLSTSLTYLLFISAATVAAMAWARQLRLREFVARAQLVEVHRFAVEEVLHRHLPPAYVQDVLAGHRAMDAPPERRVVTVLFADIVSFTPISDSLPPEELATAMARFYDVTSTVAFEHGATLDKFIGDAVMAFLGAPTAMDEAEQVTRAFAVARAWHARVGELAPAGKPLSLRVGIHQDVVAVGSFGGRRRTDFTVLGMGVNLAARLEQHCPPGRILISERAWERLPEPRPEGERKELTLKGIPGVVRTYVIAP